MIKKVHILNPFNTPCQEKKQIQCTVCKTMAKSIFYVCEAGHVICKSCQDVEDTIMEDGNEGGDYIPQKEFESDKDKKNLENIISETKQDLASGDHDVVLIPNERTEAKNDCKVDNTIVINKEHCSKSNIEPIIKYKNSNYKESESSATSNFGTSQNTKSKEEEEIQNYKIGPRPVVCPVTNCSKMVTIDSIMLHFYFDHSKVPRIILENLVPQEVVLKSSNFSAEIQCIATFIIETQKRPTKLVKKSMESITSIRNSFKENKFLLLMAVRLPTSTIKLPTLKFDTARVFTRSIHTQTEKIHGNALRVSTESLSKNSSDYKYCISKYVYDDDEVLLLWLCKLDDDEKVYSITLLGENKKQGYCYIGDAVHVRDKQVPFSLYDRSECLIVKGSAVNGLFDLENQITAIVSIIG